MKAAIPGMPKMGRARTIEAAVAIVLLAVLALAPTFVARITALFFVLNWIVLAESFNMFAGLTGYVNFGHVVFYGVGGYAGALLMANAHASPYLAVVVGGLASSLLALGISLPTTRLRGAYFAIATLSINEAFFVTFDNWDAVGSAPGFTLPISYYQPVQEYYAMLVLAVLCIAAMLLISRSKFGIALQAIKQQESTASSIGINPAYYKTMTLVFSGFFAGVAGALAIWQITFIDPPSAFNITITVNSISMAMLGGLGTVAGPIIGGALLYELTDYLGLSYPFIHLIVLGVIIIGVVLVIPDGIVGAARRLYARVRRKERAASG
ncbi:MAG: branched-chain amino acid ABC transporter permease [Nitrososphaerales archaeon]|nr:branched-chain amino acid ABC transporter permease [Nitrososphaerales archaeon]